MRWRPAPAGPWVRRFGLWDSSSVRPAAQRLVVGVFPSVITYTAIVQQ